MSALFFQIFGQSRALRKMSESDLKRPKALGNDFRWAGGMEQTSQALELAHPLPQLTCDGCTAP